MPHGLSHSICRVLSGGENFHSAKSVALRLSPSSTRLPASSPALVEPREIAVVRLPARVEIDAVRGAVRVAAPFEIGDERDLLGNVIGCARQHVGRHDVQRRDVVVERLRVQRGDFPRAAAGAARALLHLVFAGIGVGRQVADVGDVHHVPDAIAVPAQHALQRVLEQERAVVADVLVVVDGRPHV